MSHLVTGATGFAGSSLVRLLTRQGRQVVALSRTGDPGSLQGIEGAEIRSCDLTSAEEISRQIDEVRPEAVFHLAARTFVPDSTKDAVGFIETNVVGTLRLLSAIRQHVSSCRVLVVGSAGVYGASGRDGRPLAETAPLRPMDPYGASKAAAELWALQEHASSGLAVVCVRPFGHIGPRQSPRFVSANFARQIGRIQCGEQAPVIEVGNLDAVREFNDVEDIVEGYVAALERGEAGQVYNLCSGRGRTIRELLALLLQRSGIEADVRTRPERLRPADVPALVGDPSRAREQLGWQVRVPLEDTIDRILDRWTARDHAKGSIG